LFDILAQGALHHMHPGYVCALETRNNHATKIKGANYGINCEQPKYRILG